MNIYMAAQSKSNKQPPRSAQSRRKTAAADCAAAFPDSQLSSEERAIAVRLTCVLRTREYWLGPFIEWLLEKDIESNTEGVSIEAAIKDLQDLAALSTWFGKLTTWRESSSPLFRYYSQKTLPDKTDEAYQDRLSSLDEHDFLDLVKLWRLEHPEPPKKLRAPAGVSQHMSDPDSD